MLPLGNAKSNAHDITVLMDYGSLTYTPMQNRISPLVCHRRKPKASNRPFVVRGCLFSERKKTSDPSVHLLWTPRSVVLVRARPRLVKAVHPRVSKRPETTVLPLCGRSFKLLILLALQYSQDFSILEMILKYSSAKYSCSFQAAIIIPDSFKFLEKILDPIYFFQYIF